LPATTRRTAIITTTGGRAATDGEAARAGSRGNKRHEHDQKGDILHGVWRLTNAPIVDAVRARTMAY